MKTKAFVLFLIMLMFVLPKADVFAPDNFERGERQVFPPWRKTCRRAVD